MSDTEKIYSEIIILGAGPAGLSLACLLKKRGFDNFVIIEKEDEAGGLCRSKDVDGSPFDIGGGHFLDVRRSNVNKFLFEYMPENEWALFERNSKIYMDDSFIDHPIEANIWQMKKEKQIEYLKSIAVAGCNLKNDKPEKFVEWIYWKLGEKIATEYMIPYNIKMFSSDLDELGTYWLEKLPNVSFEETLLSCLDKKAYGTQPGHAKFYYPISCGYGEVWRRMSDSIADRIFYKELVELVDFEQMKVVTQGGKQFFGKKVVSTIPWNSIKSFVGMPEELNLLVKQLKHSSIVTRYHEENLETDAHWIYYPNLMIPYHRILVRHNFAKGSRGYWTETRVERTDMYEERARFSYVNDYAYPLNTLNKPYIMDRLLMWATEKNFFGLGRWGEHQHYNSDVVVEKAMKMADKLLESIV